MEVKRKVIAMQRQLLIKLSDYEADIGRLYEAYAAAFPELAEFWQTLARDEKKHAAFLSSMLSLADKGKVFFGFGKYDKEAIQASQTAVSNEWAAVQAGPVTLRHALRFAFEIETLLLDGQFYASITSDAGEYELIAKHLLKDEQLHLALVKRVFRERFAAEIDAPQAD